MFDQFLGKLSHWNNIFKQLWIDGSKLVKTGKKQFVLLDSLLEKIEGGKKFQGIIMMEATMF